jgi:Arc/MetJ family transcription regulator
VEVDDGLTTEAQHLMQTKKFVLDLAMRFAMWQPTRGHKAGRTNAVNITPASTVSR